MFKRPYVYYNKIDDLVLGYRFFNKSFFDCLSLTYRADFGAFSNREIFSYFFGYPIVCARMIFWSATVLLQHRFLEFLYSYPLDKPWHSLS